MHSAAYEVIERQIKVTALPKRFSIPMRKSGKCNFASPSAKDVAQLRLLRHPRFRAAYDFLLRGNQANTWTISASGGRTCNVPIPTLRWTSLLDDEPGDESAPSQKRRRRPVSDRQPVNEQEKNGLFRAWQ